MLNKSNKSLNLHGLLRIVLLFSLFSPLFDVDTNFIYFSHWINMKTIFVYIGASDSTSSHKNVHINFFFHQLNHKISLLIWYEKKSETKNKRWRIHKIQEKKISKYFSLELFAEIKFFYLCSSWVEVTTTTKCSSFKIANWYSWQHQVSLFMGNMPPKQLFHNLLEFQVALC